MPGTTLNPKNLTGLVLVSIFLCLISETIESFSQSSTNQVEQSVNTSNTSASSLPKQPQVIPPQPVLDPNPKYTNEARKAGIEGNVGLSLTVTEDGKTRDIEVIKGLEPGLDEQAISAVKKWRFKPATKDGVPIAVPIHISVVFRLYHH